MGEWERGFEGVEKSIARRPTSHPRCCGNAEIPSMSRGCVAPATLMNESRSVTVETRRREESPVAMAMPSAGRDRAKWRWRVTSEMSGPSIVIVVFINHHHHHHTQSSVSVDGRFLLVGFPSQNVSVLIFWSSSLIINRELEGSFRVEVSDCRRQH